MTTEQPTPEDVAMAQVCGQCRKPCKVIRDYGYGYLKTPGWMSNCCGATVSRLPTPSPSSERK